MVLDIVMLRGLEVCESTTQGGQVDHSRTTSSGRVRTAPHKETHAPARKRARSRTSAGTRGNKNTTATPEAGPQPPPTPDLQQIQAEATPAHARTHARIGAPDLQVIDGGAGAPPLPAVDPGPLTPEQEDAFLLEANARLMEKRKAYREEEERRLAAAAEQRERDRANGAKPYLRDPPSPEAPK